MATEALLQAYESLYPKIQENEEPEIILPNYLRHRREEITKDCEKGFNLANNILEETLGVKAHKPRRVELHLIPRIKYEGKLWNVQGIPNSKADEIYINSALYHQDLYPYLPVVDLDQQEGEYSFRNYKSNTTPVETIAEEIIHLTLYEFSYNLIKQERATQKLFEGYLKN